MATARRVPLADNPNAANSPFRQQTLNVKRQRPHTVELHDTDVSRPPQKKQALENPASISRHRIIRDDEVDIFNPGVKKDGKPVPEFQKKLASVRESARGQNKLEKLDKSNADAETVRQWRRHYRRVFPTFVFYFESLPPDMAYKASRQIATLGAREEKFFSKAVTHIVTSRPIPADSADSRQSSHMGSRTINPSLLDKGVESHRSRHVLDVASQRRSQAQSGSFDVLVKAREMNIKIWALEKFERMMFTMFDLDNQDEEALRTQKAAKGTDLVQLLKNERENRPGQAAPWQEIIPFKEYYIYIHDMDEKVKPVLLREYKKCSVREDGEWPMFRSVSSGRCPFVEEPVETKEERIKRKQKEALKAEQEQRRREQASVAARTRSATKSPQKAPPLQEQAESVTNKMPKPTVPSASTFNPPKLRNAASGNLDSMPPMLGSTRANFQGITRNPGGEPTASGVQRDVTSAIRSQMISSTAAAPGGGRVGTSREMHQLQRRVLEQRTGSNFSAQNSMGSSYLNDVRAAINNDSRRAARKDASNLARIHEDDTLSDQEGQQPRAQVTRKRVAAVAKRQRDPKPGYCENCRNKYDDFLEHIESKRHLKFAHDNEQFVELDELLAKLARH